MTILSWLSGQVGSQIKLKIVACTTLPVTVCGGATADAKGM